MASNIPRYFKGDKPSHDINGRKEMKKLGEHQKMGVDTSKNQHYAGKKPSSPQSPEEKTKFGPNKLPRQNFKFSEFKHELNEHLRKPSGSEHPLNDPFLTSLEKQLEECHQVNADLLKELEESKKKSKGLEEMLSSLTEQLNTCTKTITKKDRQLKEMNIFLSLYGEKKDKKVNQVKSTGNLITSSFHSNQTELSAKSEENFIGKKQKIRNSFSRIFSFYKQKPSRFSINAIDIIYEPQIKSNNSVADISDLCHLLREKELAIADLQLEIVTQRNVMNEMTEKLKQLEDEHYTNIISKRKCSNSSMITNSLANVNFRKSVEHDDPQEIMGSFYVLTKNKTKKNFIGNLLLNKNINWINLLQNIKKIFKNFINIIDAKSNIGIGCDSILSLIVGKKTWAIEHVPCQQLPCSFLSGYHDKIYILLKSTQQKTTDELSFDLLVSNQLLSRYVDDILKFKRIIFYGPQFSGKYYLATQLAEHVHGILTSSGSNMVQVKEIFASNSAFLAAQLNNLAEKNETRNMINIVLIKNIDASKDNSINQSFRKFFSKIRNWRFYIIATCVKNNKLVKDLEMEYKFKINRLAPHMEPLENIIPRILVRDSINSRGSMKSVETDKNIAEFLKSTWNFINKLLESNDKADHVIGPFVFTSCSVNLNMAEWFVRTWNSKIIPLLKHSLDVTPETEPFEWVMDKIPWRISRLSLNRLGVIHKLKN